MAEGFQSLYPALGTFLHQASLPKTLKALRKETSFEADEADAGEEATRVEAAQQLLIALTQALVEWTAPAAGKTSNVRKRKASLPDAGLTKPASGEWVDDATQAGSSKKRKISSTADPPNDDVDTKAEEDVDKDPFQVFVGGLPFKHKEEILRRDFGECGTITRLDYPKDDSGRGKGYAFISFDSEEGALAALKYDCEAYAGRTLKVNRAGEAAQKERLEDREQTVFVKNMPKGVTEAKVKAWFAECGEIKSLRLPKDLQGSTKGQAYIIFKEKGGCAKALSYHEADFEGRQMVVRMVTDTADLQAVQKEKGKKGKRKGKSKEKSKGKGQVDHDTEAKGKDKTARATEEEEHGA
eukprot:TRINITY_DN6696_c0_g1_i1.p1 TRINITY_DN6696_c0_g1~~TRINITY_DN6696_c0_g1_i1.p1  ORF type:complete len:354 (-),score=95.51 TRINITY_DN6696_c0_g1_i1:359-1420(-)